MFAKKYLDFLLSFRTIYLFIIVVSTLFFVVNIDSKQLSNDERAWLIGTSQYNKLIQKGATSQDGSKVEIFLKDGKINTANINELRTIFNFLITKTSQESVSSFFNHKFATLQTDGESSFIELASLEKLSDDLIFDKLHSHLNDFSQFFGSDGSIIFYVYGFNINNLELNTTLDYKISQFVPYSTPFDESIFLLGTLIVLTILLSIFFRNLSAPLIGISFIIATSSATIYIFKEIIGDYTAHISILILSFVISFLDFLYVYYRWFILQQKRDSQNSIIRTIERTFAPVTVTKIINIIGIGSLIFVETDILKSLGAMVIISSITGMFYTYTYLPLVFSYLNITNPHTKSEHMFSLFSEQIKNYNKHFLYVFIYVTASMMIFGLYYFNNSHENKNIDNSRVIKLAIDVNQTEISIELLEKLQQFSQIINYDQQNNNIDEVEKIVSIYTEINSLYKQEQNKELNLSSSDFDLDRYIFMLDMFGGTESYFDKNQTRIDIYLKESSSKNKILNNLEKSKMEFSIIDTDSLLQTAINESFMILASLLIFILFIIFIAILLLTKSYLYGLIGLFLTIVPLIWFLSIVAILNINLSTDMFIAMIIAVAISSDSMIHLLHYYNKLEQENRFADNGINRIFLYVESPLIFGNIILAVTFLMLAFFGIASLVTIGIYSTMIVLFSLMTDIFILPVVILETRAKWREQIVINSN